MKSMFLHLGFAFIAAGIITFIVKLFFPSSEYWVVLVVILFGLILCIISYYWRYIATKIPWEMIQRDINPNKFISVKISNPETLSTQTGIHQDFFIANTIHFLSTLNSDVNITLSGSLFLDNKKNGELVTKNITIKKNGKGEISCWSFIRYPQNTEKIYEKPNDPSISSNRLFLKLTGVDTHDRKYLWYV